MSKKCNSDSYLIECSYILDEYRNKCLYTLYQPIIGCDAVSLYMTLYHHKGEDLSLMTRLFKVMGISTDRINDSFDKLEAVGLVKTFYNEKDSKFIFTILLPLTPGHFFEHRILNTMLFNVMNREEYQKCKAQHFFDPLEKGDFVNVTSSFSEVIDITMLHNQELKTADNLFYQSDIGMIEDQYNIDLFFQSIVDYQIPKKILTQDVVVLIKQLGMLYHIGVMDMLDIVKRCSDKKEVDLKALSKACQTHYDLKMPSKLCNVHHKQSVTYKSLNVDDALETHIRYLEQVTPYQLLKNKYGGKEPVKRELMLIETLLTSQGVQPGVMNVLIEYTLASCDGALPRSFMEYHISKWTRKKIKTVQEAMAVAKASNNQEEVPAWSTNSVSTTPNDEQLDIEEFMKKYD